MRGAESWRPRKSLPPFPPGTVTGYGDVSNPRKMPSGWHFLTNADAMPTPVRNMCSGGIVSVLPEGRPGGSGVGARTAQLGVADYSRLRVSTSTSCSPSCRRPSSTTRFSVSRGMPASPPSARMVNSTSTSGLLALRGSTATLTTSRTLLPGTALI